jgi:multimeric flavodoxin WrbA
MKILGLSCSPRKSGNTVILLEEALNGALQEGAETELFSVSGKDIKPCDGCWACFGTGKCHIKDDMQTLCDKMVEADGIIFGTPVYVYSMTGQAKIIMDRMLALNGPGRNLANKVGGVIVVAGSIGIIDPAKDLYFMMVMKKMVPANLVAVYASNKGDAREMNQGMQAAHNLGREMVQIAAKKFTYPDGFPRNFFAYGTHTR